MAQFNTDPAAIDLSSDTTSMASGSEEFFDETLHKYMLARIEADPEGFLEQWNAYYKSVEKWCSEIVSLHDDMCDIDVGRKCNNNGAVEDPKQGGKNTTARVPGGARIELRAPLKKYPGARGVPGFKEENFSFPMLQSRPFYLS